MEIKITADGACVLVIVIAIIFTLVISVFSYDGGANAAFNCLAKGATEIGCRDILNVKK